MTFLNPIYLWSLLGVLIPIAIHLWSRRKVVKIKVGSIRLLQESEPRQTSTFRPNELWLLLLRIVTILLLALLISGPQFKKTSVNNELLYVIEPSLMADEYMENMLDSIPEESIRLLTTDFPEMEDYDKATFKNAVPDYWQLAQEMKSLPSDSIIVFTKGFVSGINGKRPETSSHINWLVLNSDEAVESVIEARKKGDSLELLTVLSDANKIQFEKKTVFENNETVKYNIGKDSILLKDMTLPIELENPINILLVYQDSLVREQQYIEAGYQSVAKFLQRPINIVNTTKDDSVDIGKYDISIWLGIEPKANSQKTRLIFNPDPLAAELIEEGLSKNEYFLTSSLNSENSVAQQLPEKLLSLLKLHKGLDKEIQQDDKRVAGTEELRPNVSKKLERFQEAGFIDISPWLWALLLLILPAERIMAKYRKQ